MCGIAGFNFKDIQKVEAGMADLRHRGPDQSGIFSDEKITLAHTRLSIIDLSEAGRQPMQSEDGEMVLVFNGEIYNFQELKKNLAQKYNFKSQSDTEVIIYGYKEEGVDFFEKLRGMWALALYDKGKQILILARDFFGIKPLLYSLNKENIYFSSELKVLLEWLNPGSEDLDKEAYGYYFHLGYFPAPHTPFLTVKKLNPGEILIYDLNKKIAEFKKLKWRGEATENDSDIVKDFKEVFKRSIECHFISDVPVSLLFSGGNDSSLVAALAQDLGYVFRAFHFQVEGKSDYQYAKAASRHLGLKMETLFANKADVKRTYEELWQWLDEPFADISIIPSVMIYALVGQETKVALTGDGGDDLLGGYVRHRYFENLKFRNNSNRLFKILYGASRLNNLFGQRYLTPLAVRLLNRAEKSELFDITSAFLEKSSLSHLNVGSDLERIFKSLTEMKADWPDVPAELFYDLFFYLPNDLMYKTDMASMRYSVEARVPFLDKEIWRFLGRVYSSGNSEYFRQKSLIKKVLSDYLPANLVYRKKEGFSFSLKSFLSQEIERDFSECLDYYSKNFSIFNLNVKLVKSLHKDKRFREIVFAKYPRFVFALISNYKFLKETAKI